MELKIKQPRKDKKVKKVLVIEEINNASILIITCYRLIGYKCYFLRAQQKFEDSFFYGILEEGGLIHKIDLDQRVWSYCGLCTDKALYSFDKIYSQFSCNKYIGYTIALYKNREIENIYKKVILEKAAKFFYLNEIISALARKFIPAKIYFIPARGTERFRTSGTEAYFYFEFRKIIDKAGISYKKEEGAIFPLWMIFLGFLCWQIDKFKSFLLVFFLNVQLLCRSLSGIFFKEIKLNRHVKYGIMLIDPSKELANKMQEANFLIDNTTILKKDILLITYKKLTNKQKEFLASRSLSFWDDLYNHVNSISAKKAIFFSIRCMFDFSSYYFVLDTYIKSIYIYAIWDSFNHNFRLDNLISHNDLGLKSVGRNVVLMEKNPFLRTWHYEHSIGHRILTVLPGNHFMNQCYHSLSFIVYDYYIIWSDLLKQYFENHRQHVQKYITVGCLWAEHTVSIARGRMASRAPEIDDIRNTSNSYKFISVFDTTFGDDIMQSYNEGRKFFRHIELLLNELPDIFLIFKPKKTRRSMLRFCPEILRVYDRFFAHKRCRVLPEYLSPSEVIAFSDLVIAVPFTSPAFEALCARKKALYYDVLGRYHGAIFDRVDGLVAHNYQELLKRVKELLFETDENAYDEYLDTQVKGKIEPFLDGMAITRFRRLLSG